MVLIARAIVTAYDEAEHKADVRPAASLAGVLADIPVATDIPAEAVVAGRECTLLLYTDDDPTDAVVITIHGALPPDPPAGVETHGELTSVGADDHHLAARIEHPASSTRMDAVSGAIEARPAGTLRQTIRDTAPHVRAVPASAKFGYEDAGNNGTIALIADNGGGTGPGGTSIMGVAGRAMIRDAATVAAYGLSFWVGSFGTLSQTVTDMTAVDVALFALSSGLTITNTHFLRSTIHAQFGNYTNVYGVRLAAITGGAQRRQFQEEGVSGATADAHGNRFPSNTQFASLTGSFGGGNGVIGIANAPTAPGANPTGGGILYAAAGALLWRGSAGTITTIAPA